jgi:hypothetical protein
MLSGYPVCTCESINKKLSESLRITVNNNRHILKRIIDIIVLCAKPNILLRGHIADNSNFDVIITAFAKHDEILSENLASVHYNAKYTSPAIQNELIGICAQHACQRKDYKRLLELSLLWLLTNQLRNNCRSV